MTLPSYHIIRLLDIILSHPRKMGTHTFGNTLQMLEMLIYFGNVRYIRKF